ncbi:hypothetical protein H6P81_005298 [Aristolochia fimbriata]|uniref:Uncharacterized protein n=1 Tax=Aristolochia fimbriata TaxID=158543 RepID=A0AAV7EVG8_ARIFI|nr:hypothetical protein H6P81_005298 [Aristolochia fimbriata]
MVGLPRRGVIKVESLALLFSTASSRFRGPVPAFTLPAGLMLAGFPLPPACRRGTLMQLNLRGYALP